MLRVFKTKQELEEILPLISANLPQLIDLHVALKMNLDNLKTEAPVEVFAHPWPDVKIFIYIVRNKYIRPYISFRLTENGSLHNVDEILAAAPNLLDDFSEFLLFNTDFVIHAHLQKKLSANFRFTCIPGPGQCHTFYMSVEKQQEVSKMNITLPEGFSFCQLDAEKDAEFISGTWKYASGTDIPNTKSKIAHLPSIGVKYEDKLVAFEMLYSTGALNHQYVVPEFRGKGLGKAVELKLCQKLIEMGIWPYKFVECDNPPAMSMTNKSGLWLNVMKNDSENPASFGFQPVFRK